MQVIPLLLKEIEQEAAITRKFLERVPDSQFDYKPHEKNMDLRTLAVHIAEIPAWVKMALTTSEIDFATMDYKPTPVSNNQELLNLFEKSVEEGRSTLQAASEDALLPEWTMRAGDKVIAVLSKYEVIRHALAQTIHHRAQLGMYLRLLNIPIPGSYGPSADDNGMGS